MLFIKYEDNKEILVTYTQFLTNSQQYLCSIGYKHISILKIIIQSQISHSEIFWVLKGSQATRIWILDMFKKVKVIEVSLEHLSMTT